MPNEYRIQMTTVESPLAINEAGFTILVGYEPNLNVFAGYDLSRHATFTAGSPSVQVRRTTLNRALQNGLAFETKSNDEIVIGIRSDLLQFYSYHAAELHRFGDNAYALATLKRASELESISDDDVSSLPAERQRLVRETSRWSRSRGFSQQVLNAYGNRCAVTRWQLRLVEAAHILPVKAGSESIDHVQNGIALSPTYHRAFDRGLIYLDDDMVMRINHSVVAELGGLNLDAGLSELESSLGEIHLPHDSRQRPDPHFIRLANEHRGIG